MADMSERPHAEGIAALKADVMARGGSFVPDANPLVRNVALWRATQGGRSRLQIRAAYLYELVKLAKMEIRAAWTLAGEHLFPLNTPFGFPNCPDAEAVAYMRNLDVSAEDVPRVRDAVRPWSGDVTEACVNSWWEADPDTLQGLGAWGAEARSQDVYWAGGWTENHSIRDYAKVLRIGFAAIKRDVEQRLAEADIGAGHFPRKENFWKAALHVCDAGMLLGRRYADLASAMTAKASDDHDRERLLKIAETCARVPAEGARTFHEAVQALWLAHVLTCGEDGINANSIGRLDQILYPWYEADVAAGRLTRAGALEVMEELACKLYLDYDVQAITLGGVDREGHDAANELSYIILEATRNVEFVRDVSVRLHEGSPEAFVGLAAELVARGGGIPFFFNDACFIKALTDRGIALEDARDYAPIGCIELTIPGRANPHAVSGWFNSTKCLELALFDGKDPRSGTQLGPRTGGLADFQTFDDLFEAYCAQVDFFARRMVYHCNRGELRQRELGPLPYWSVLTDDCIERGRDITDGGAVYNYHSVCFLGTANTADGMAALAKLVFEEGLLGADDVLDALRADFDGAEPLRQALLNRAPKYGNDHAQVDEMARRVDEHFIHLMDGMESPVGGRYFVHLFSFVANIPFGMMVGATPDGRRAGEPLAYSLSAHQGRDVEGVTAMLKSLARLPHDQAAGSSAAIIDLDEALVQGDEGVRTLAQLLRAAVAMGIGQLQWNVTTVERLEKAQEDPEKYGNIVVRVAGFSQMFKLVDEEMQAHIIARTKHRH